MRDWASFWQRLLGDWRLDKNQVDALYHYQMLVKNHLRSEIEQEFHSHAGNIQEAASLILYSAELDQTIEVVKERLADLGVSAEAEELADAQKDFVNECYDVAGEELGTSLIYFDCLSAWAYHLRITARDPRIGQGEREEVRYLLEQNQAVLKKAHADILTRNADKSTVEKALRNIEAGEDRFFALLAIFLA